MKLLYQLHNIGIFLEDGDCQWNKRIRDDLSRVLDGFEIFIGEKTIGYRIILKPFYQLNIESDSYCVPESSYIMPDSTFVYLSHKIAYRKINAAIELWIESNAWFVLFMIEFLLEEQGKTFVHGAAISIQKEEHKEGYLLLAFGGIGKTSFVSAALKQNNVKLLGDDLIILNQNGTMEAYPRPFCLYRYHQPLFPEYFSANKVHYKEFKEKQYIRRLYRRIKRELGIPDRNVYSYVPVSPVALFSKEKIEREEIPICKVFILRRKSGIKKIYISSNQNIEDVVNFAHGVILHEWDIALHMKLNEMAQKQEDFLKYISGIRQIIMQSLKGIKEYIYVDIPENYNAERACAELNKIIFNTGM